ncbi:MAG: hypothetical protein JRC68_02835 [Deltaproteobacteria bacterium]|nr:hypothetical protein [Deltaproteobacteria bacterium]
MNEKITLWDRCLVGFFGWLTGIPLLNNSENKIFLADEKKIKSKEMTFRNNQERTSERSVMINGRNLFQ